MENKEYYGLIFFEMKKLLYFIILIAMVNNCSNSPRYQSGGKSAIIPAKTNDKTSSKNKKKKIKHKKVMKGISSFYGLNDGFHGKLTANGEIFDMYGLTAAHKTLPLNTIVRVTNLDKDKSLILRINDRGPYVGKRILDCSYGAATKLDFVNEGIAKVKVEVIEWGDNKYMKHRVEN